MLIILKNIYITALLITSDWPLNDLFHPYPIIIYVNDCLKWYGLGIGMRAAIMGRGRRPREIMAVRRLIPIPYHYKQPLTYLLIGS